MEEPELVLHGFVAAFVPLLVAFFQGEIGSTALLYRLVVKPSLHGRRQQMVARLVSGCKTPQSLAVATKVVSQTGCDARLDIGRRVPARG